MLVVLSLMGKKARPVSPAPYHAGMTAATARAECLVCHDPGRPDAPSPLPESHPLRWKKEDVSCLVCHTPPSAGPRERAAYAFTAEGRNAQ